MKKYPFLLLLSLAIYLLHFFVTKHGIYGDGNGYYAIAHTLLFQRGLNFAPIYNHLSSFQGAHYQFSRIFWDTHPTSTGILNAPWLIGTALFWLPSLFFTFAVSQILRLSISPFHPVYEISCGIAGILLVIGGLALLERYLQRYFSNRRIPSLTVLSLFFASQLFYYASFEPALSHQVTFFLVCLFLFLKDTKIRSGILSLAYGLIAGFIFITRMGDLFLIAPVLSLQIIDWFKKKNWESLIGLAAFIFAISPQLLFQNALYGNLFQNPYLQGEKGSFHIFTPFSLWNHLLSLQGGFFFWSPLFLLAVIGLVRHKEKLSVFTLIFFTLFIASWERFSPSGFGNRFFVAAIPYFSTGIGTMLSISRKKVIVFLAFCFLWNALLIAQFYMF